MTVVRAALAVLVSASCAASDDGAGDATTEVESSSSDGAMFDIDDRDELLTQADCESAAQSELGSKCAWINVRLPEPPCSSDAVAPQCVGMSYVGNGCQFFDCPDSDAGVDRVLPDGRRPRRGLREPTVGVVRPDGDDERLARTLRPRRAA